MASHASAERIASKEKSPIASSPQLSCSLLQEDDLGNADRGRDFTRQQQDHASPGGSGGQPIKHRLDEREKSGKRLVRGARQRHDRDGIEPANGSSDDGQAAPRSVVQQHCHMRQAPRPRSRRPAQVQPTRLNNEYHPDSRRRCGEGGASRTTVSMSPTTAPQALAQSAMNRAVNVSPVGAAMLSIRMCGARTAISATPALCATTRSAARRRSPAMTGGRAAPMSSPARRTPWPGGASPNTWAIGLNTSTRPASRNRSRNPAASERPRRPRAARPTMAAANTLTHRQGRAHGKPNHLSSRYRQRARRWPMGAWRPRCIRAPAREAGNLERPVPVPQAVLREPLQDWSARWWKAAFLSCQIMKQARAALQVAFRSAPAPRWGRTKQLLTVDLVFADRLLALRVRSANR